MTTKRLYVYFYHPDHLGSTSLVTNSYGGITQNISYIPYGEVFVEETSGGWQSPYYFNAKELDEETGLYYYGARYLDPAGTRWLSADPMLEKYVGMSPYNYCAGNPVKLVDEDGREFTDVAECLISSLEDKIKERIENIDNKKTKWWTFDKKRLDVDRKECEDALAEFKTMRESDQVYDVRLFDKAYAHEGEVETIGKVGYDREKNQFVIFISEPIDFSKSYNDFSSLVHELKHGYQFEVGKLSFKYDPEKNETIVFKSGYLYDYTDEVEAHKRGGMFGGGNTANDGAYSELRKYRGSEHHIGDDNYHQYIQSKTKDNEDKLKNNIYRYNH